MMNMGDGTFVNATEGSGIEFITSDITSIEWVTHDFDNDGYLDIFGAGHIFKNNGDMTFEISEIDFFNGPVGDLNNDGFLDIITSGNVQFNDGNDNNYFVVNLDGIESNKNGIGARVTVYTESFAQVREIRSGDGFRYMSSLNAYFGLGQDSEIDSVKVSWPSGITDVIDNPDINSSLSIEEGNGRRRAIESLTGWHAVMTFTPNPTQGQSEIVFESDENEPIVIEVCDVSGRVIKRLFNQDILNGHSYRIDFDGSELPNGVYLLRMTNGSETKTSKFMIAR